MVVIIAQSKTELCNVKCDKSLLKGLLMTKTAMITELKELKAFSFCLCV